MSSPEKIEKSPIRRGKREKSMKIKDKSPEKMKDSPTKIWNNFYQWKIIVFYYNLLNNKNKLLYFFLLISHYL